MAADSLMVSEIDKNVNLEANIKAKHEKTHSKDPSKSKLDLQIWKSHMMHSYLL